MAFALVLLKYYYISYLLSKTVQTFFYFFIYYVQTRSGLKNREIVELYGITVLPQMG